eukprot:5392343-Prymnesium_polylepis.1
MLLHTDPLGVYTAAFNLIPVARNARSPSSEARYGGGAERRRAATPLVVGRREALHLASQAVAASCIRPQPQDRHAFHV